MTTEQQRIAIAEKCGWKVIETNDCNGADNYWLSKDGQNVWIDDCLVDLPLPNYTANLNAMHEAWLHLTPNEKFLYAGTLHQTLARQYDLSYGQGAWNALSDGDKLTQLQNPKAPIRAEAFCRTFWPERFDK